MVARRQLVAAGITGKAIDHRVRSGRLHVRHRGVYAVGHTAVPPLAREFAALLACGPGSVLSHRSAAVLWGLLPRDTGPVEITRARTRRDGPDGVTVHCVAELPARDVRRRHGLLLTAPDRTVLDLAATGAPDLEAALSEALLRRLVAPQALLDRATGRSGAGALKTLLADGATPTRSEAERRLLALVRRAGLPSPRTNVRIGRWEVDAVWAERRVVVEVDGYAFHGGRAAFERDRLRDAELQAAGYRVVRITWRQLDEAREAVAIRLAAVLAA